MKQKDNTQDSITKPLLAGLTAQKATKTEDTKTTAAKPAFGKTTTKQADLYQDPGNGYNANRTFIQD